ncbi:SRP40, C-terminal domain-containing protein [Daldinia grandis]|nr:SRP40, C-terminal domain-containing protein [Daldinia grandis]
MFGNPRSQPPSTYSQGPPNWLFSNNSNNSASVPSDSTTPEMAKKSQKTAKAAVAPKTAPSSSTSQNQAPPDQLMDLVESFLSDQGFDNAHREFQKHRAKKGWKGQNASKQKNKAHHSLVSVFQTWETFSSQANTPIIPKEDPMQKITKVSSSSSSSESDSSDDSSSDSSSDSDSDSDDSKDVAMGDAPVDDESSSSESSSSDDSDSDSDSESGSDGEKKTSKKPATGAVTIGKNPLKRKAVSESSSSSDSDSDMSDSSSEDERPQTKKAKTKASPDESSSSSSSGSSGDESSDDDKSSSSESESDSSDSESDEEPKVDLKAAAAVPLPESGSSSSDSESESDSEDGKPQRPSKGVAPNGTGSDTSVTLDKASPEFGSTSYPPLPPDPVASKINNRGKNGAKAQNQPFSRIRQDVAIDPRLSSNAYVSHEYGDKAHQDLIVTKGKGFTKEKNKKKRGSYKGGPLDINKSRSIKFED